MAKRKSPISLIIKNVKNLLPFLGVLFVFAGIIGLVLIQDPLETSQDTRSEADQPDYLASVRTELRQDFVVDESGQIGLILEAENFSIDRITLYFYLEHPLLDVPEISIPEASGFRAEYVEVEFLDDGYLAHIEAVPNNIDWFVPPEDTTFVLIDAVPRSADSIFLTIDSDRSYVSTPSIEVVLGSPGREEFIVTDPNSEPPTQAACSAAGGTWETFPNSCVDSCEKAADPDNIMCLTVLTDGCNCGPSQCWNGETCVANPGTDPGDDEIAQCNELCETNADCAVGLRCFDVGNENRCRLATNTSNENCEDARGGIEEPDLASCNEYCASNAECETGYACYENYCRNPRNPQNNQCADPSESQAAATISGCGESCDANADCAINLRCFTGECRLATNVSSTSCTPATERTISPVYEQPTQNDQVNNENTQPVADPSDTETTPDEREKGAEMVPNEKVEYEPIIDQNATRKTYDDTYDANETLFDLIRSMAQNEESRLPFFVILLGILLLVGSGLIFFFTTLRKKQAQQRMRRSQKSNGKISIQSHDVKPGDTPFTTPTSQRTAIPQETKQELLKQIREK